ncbi:unnamed protein product, partial [marine sediment metagenome]
MFLVERRQVSGRLKNLKNKLLKIILKTCGKI